MADVVIEQEANTPSVPLYILSTNKIDTKEVFRGDEVDQKLLEAAVRRINAHVHWIEDTPEILHILKTTPRYCYCLKEGEKTLGYAIVREDESDKHLHVSWIATDSAGGGVGTRLMLKMIEENRALGHHVLTLNFRTCNQQLKHFYEKIARVAELKWMCEEVDEIYTRVTYQM